jgi:hypothetical protein
MFVDKMSMAEMSTNKLVKHQNRREVVQLSFNDISLRIPRQDFSIQLEHFFGTHNFD